LTNGKPKAKVLVVDDEPSILHAFTRALQVYGYTVKAAPDGMHALEELAEFQPDAILIDLRMPQIDGLSLLREFRAHDAAAHVPVGVVTGDVLASPPTVAALEALGARVRFKPISLADLISLVETLVAEGKGARSAS
jgi:two-component system response regulator MprA